ncbi:E3 ubiquitin-protein ligase parkin,Ubiquitin-related domain,IBR domain,Ubiquitin domain [Cinara cedri]|uniref:E3 ubiquitin-protein ligase parkin n=1 Tax=Cinara cedri TaxID=506608 RepID=A0A5E4MIF6_9HEMI|nr:E3 ubiquitin-protein ligase parkin,Ubiquitin-related domain,IBR domain,Ubiquitin domain [Cinara cedri]
MSILSNLFSSLLNYIRRIFDTIFTRRITNSLLIFVKSNTGTVVPVGLDPKWEVRDVKEFVAPKLGMIPEELTIIFAGKELHDSELLEEYNLAEQTVLHVVKSRHRNSLKHEHHISVCVEEDDEFDDKKRAEVNFYVYCSLPCDNITVGKIRVRCFKCKSGAFTVDGDPKNWNDVLKPNRITGHCEISQCTDGQVGWSEFYFKCSEHVTKGETDEAVALHLIRNNLHDIPCLACTDVRPKVFVYPCEDYHVTCLECFCNYAIVRLRERQFVLDENLGYTISCPAGCPNSLINQPYHFKALTKDHFNMYERFATEEYVLRHGGVLCPQPDCGAGILVDEECDKVTCINGCGYVFCKKCLQGYHIGECLPKEEQLIIDITGYSVDPKLVSQAKWDDASKIKIKVTTKPCPKCRTATERDGGCMHMVCTRCSFPWCWLCQTEWTRECMGSHWFS